MSRFQVHPNSLRSHGSDLREAAVAILIAGSVPVIIKLISINPVSLGIIRLLVATVGMVLFLRMYSRVSLRPLVTSGYPLLIGLLFGIHWLTFFWAIHYSNASIATVGISSYGILLYLLGLVLGESRLQLRGVFALALAIIGMILLLPDLEFKKGAGSGLLTGFCLAVLSATIYAFLPFLHKRASHINGELRALAQFCFGLAPFIVLSGGVSWTFSETELYGLAYLALVGTLVGHTLWVRVTTSLPSSVTSVIYYVYVPIGLFLSNIVLGERLNLVGYLGSGLIVVGSVVAITAPQRSGEQK